MLRKCYVFKYIGLLPLHRGLLPWVRTRIHTTLVFPHQTHFSWQYNGRYTVHQIMIVFHQLCSNRKIPQFKLKGGNPRDRLQYQQLLFVWLYKRSLNFHSFFSNIHDFVLNFLALRIRFGIWCELE